MKVAQSCLILCNPTDYSLLGSSVHGIFQARILECVAIPFSRGFSDPGVKAGSSKLQADSLPSKQPGKPKNTGVGHHCLLRNLALENIIGLPWWVSGKEFTCQCRRYGLDPWVRKIPWRKKWQHTPIFLPGKSHGQRSLAGYNPSGHKGVGHDLPTKNNNKRRRARISQE